ncbi:hypothetical protein CO230_11315 [Chryseobacterium sp. 6424]|uniref:bacteriophage spanin2 family protein n=1 Tax=Chryseobacterium sp. 6424 TaxID=2039166 RepID=UPI000EFAFF77|nr:bacteriophage spanin2 family protein [Chryseobacterium sp. 6424]AYO58652.1 hypothetical protein CO230_11315 [Chryseobacterium sp. 6424]
MKTFRALLFTIVIFALSSCHTRVVTPDKPLRNNSLELYQRYTFQLKDARYVKMEVLKVDEQNVYGKDRKRQSIILKREEIREAKKIDVFSSVAIGLAAVAAVIFVPI